MQFIKTKVIQPLAEMPPYQKYLVMMVGTLGGIVPIPAVTSFVTMGLGAAARLNPQGIAVATAWNLILTPMQFICMVPFAQAGKVLLTALLGMLLAFDPSESASAGSDNWFWQQSRALKSSVDNMEPSLAAIKNANGISEVLATSGAMLGIATCAWIIVTVAAFGTSVAVVKPILSRKRLVKKD
eukprot:GILI01029661.1.p1 GENE.GILI01029661.1~~GILI01029661.1.p1  ORF type:complete len:184 (-),score=22.51 GILI01029661.1:75-626(-)